MGICEVKHGHQSQAMRSEFHSKLDLLGFLSTDKELSIQCIAIESDFVHPSKLMNSFQVITLRRVRLTVLVLLGHNIDSFYFTNTWEAM